MSWAFTETELDDHNVIKRARELVEKYQDETVRRAIRYDVGLILFAYLAGGMTVQGLMIALRDLEAGIEEDLAR